MQGLSICLYRFFLISALIVSRRGRKIHDIGFRSWPSWPSWPPGRIYRRLTPRDSRYIQEASHSHFLKVMQMDAYRSCCHLIGFPLLTVQFTRQASPPHRWQAEGVLSTPSLAPQTARPCDTDQPPSREHLPSLCIRLNKLTVTRNRQHTKTSGLAAAMPRNYDYMINYSCYNRCSGPLRNNVESISNLNLPR